MAERLSDPRAAAHASQGGMTEDRWRVTAAGGRGKPKLLRTWIGPLGCREPKPKRRRASSCVQNPRGAADDLLEALGAPLGDHAPPRGSRGADPRFSMRAVRLAAASRCASARQTHSGVAGPIPEHPLWRPLGEQRPQLLSNASPPSGSDAAPTTRARNRGTRRYRCLARYPEPREGTGPEGRRSASGPTRRARPRSAVRSGRGRLARPGASSQGVGLPTIRSPHPELAAGQDGGRGRPVTRCMMSASEPPGSSMS